MLLTSGISMTSRLFAVLYVFFSLAARAYAHDFWIEPVTYRPAAGKPLAIRLMQGEHFRGEPVVRNDARIERFVIRGDETRAIGGTTGHEPAGRIDRVSPGDSIVGYRTRPLRHERMTAERFEAYLREEGLEHVIRIRAKRGEANRSASEMYSRSAKTLLVPSGGKPRFDVPLGFRLEIVPERDPHDIGHPTVSMRVVFEGRPIPDVLVTAIHRYGASTAVRERTNDEGRVTLSVPQPGPWLIKAVHMIEAPEGSGVEWESVWATLTFERNRSGRSGSIK